VRTVGSVVRTLIASLFVSLDGVVEAPQEWNPPYFDEEMGAEVGKTMMSADAFLLGRRTYQEWSAFWPAQSPEENPMAGFINSAAKYVVSTTLKSADWTNSTVIDGDVATEVPKLKQQPGKDIIVSGSGTLVRSLLAEGLVDELRLLLHPVVVGSGQRLFDETDERRGLELVDSHALGTGVVSLAYRPIRESA
jgi:dihydrofolate reductase